MITWREERQLDIPIDEAWHLFDHTRLQRLIPNVVQHEVIERKPGVVGSTYRQTYMQGNRLETYIVTDLAYTNEPDFKQNTIGFTLAKIFKIEMTFTLKPLGHARCLLIYTGKNEGANFVGKSLLSLGGERENEKIVQGLLKRVEEEAAKQKKNNA
ncbi:hypothetical protein RCC94_13270 [Exiguobacterium acetylicum]|uniref:hypothetical protein n=1 Tax=Exiguobacterium acetylicum TaxID=41170 RepID=UPI0027E0F058|nr:hypothetical protein [Exiguobacterium acetylicum]MDQ6468462.1 hypothetical protein [Exiguobacterium acetylicum]